MYYVLIESFHKYNWDRPNEFPIGVFDDLENAVDAAEELASDKVNEAIKRHGKTCTVETKPGWHGHTNTVKISFSFDRPTEVWQYLIMAFEPNKINFRYFDMTEVASNENRV